MTNSLTMESAWGSIASSNSKRSTEVAQEGMNPGCNSEEEVRFIDAGVNSWVEVKTDELRAGRDREGVCKLG